MADLTVHAAGAEFVRPGGREGWWHREGMPKDPDDTVVSPFEFVSVAGIHAITALDRLAQMRPDATPIMLGSPHEAGLLFERMRAERPEFWLEAARRFDLDLWVVERERKFQTYRDAELDYLRRGDWPNEAQPILDLATPREILSGQFKPVVVIALLPTADVTEAAAYLRFGGWNACPPPPVHIAFARRWLDKYGAVPVVNTHDVVEFRVARPVMNRDEALALARVQFYYCTDSIPETLEESAAGLIGSTVWYFWWD